ncbi:MAG: very short patch repair endonuclease [Syntrophobacteraceae bacterium]
MAAVKGKNTSPELRVRQTLHKMGHRFRLHRKDLPGIPDIVLPRHRLCVFVHGCFWHQHPGCKRATLPETNREFWTKKLNKNRMRDEATLRALVSMGWHVFVIWECEARSSAHIESTLNSVLLQLNPLL